MIGYISNPIQKPQITLSSKKYAQKEIMDGHSIESVLADPNSSLVDRRKKKKSQIQQYRKEASSKIDLRDQYYKREH